METLALLILFPTLILVTIQDFKHRLISWGFLPILFIGFFIGQYSESTFLVFKNFAINCSFLLLQYLLLSLYFSVKQKKWINISNHQIGWGDIWFFVLMAMAFSTVHFILIFVTGLIFSLLLFLILKAIKIVKQVTVPLAGTFSIFLILIQIGAYFSHYNLHNDDGLIELISRGYV